MVSTTTKAGDETLIPGESRKGRRLWPWIVGLVLVGFFGYRLVSQRATAAGARQATRSIPVSVVQSRRGDVPVYLRGLGSVTPFKTATIKTRVDGQLMSVAFAEGQVVHEGDLLAQIDPRPYEVQLEQAQGQLARDQAALRDAQINVDRYTDLFKDQILAKQTLDSQKAAADQFNGAIKVDQAQIDNAKLQMTYCRITAPFAGRVGLRLVDPGNIVHAADQGGLLVLTQLQPIAAIFSLPQDDLSRVFPKFKAGTALSVEAWDRDNARKVAQGTLLSIDNQIDPTTGTYKLKAVFDNKDEQLFANQFLNIRLLIDVQKDVVIVPSAAVQKGPQGSFVFVVTGNQVGIKNVNPGLTEGLDTGILSGLEPGESVVVEGQDKIQDKSLVDVQAKGAPGAAPGPARSPRSAEPRKAR